MTKLCPNCKEILSAEHGMTNMNTGKGFTYWQCRSCNRRYKETYQIDYTTNTKKTLTVEDVT